MNTLKLFFMAIEEKVAFVPGEVCYPKEFRKYNTLRINFSYPSKEEITEGVKRLSSVIKKYHATNKNLSMN
jgi:2-aminoadipate transaminase